MSPLLEEWLDDARKIQQRGGSIIDVGLSLRAFTEDGGRRIAAVNALGMELGWSIKQRVELLRWAAGGITDDVLESFVPSWFPGR